MKTDICWSHPHIQFNDGCCLPNSMLSTKQYVVYQTVCCLPNSMLSTKQYVVYQTVCCLPNSMLSTKQYVVYQTVCCLPNSMLSTKQYVVYQTVCCLPNSMLSGWRLRCTKLLIQHFAKSWMPLVTCERSGFHKVLFYMGNKFLCVCVLKWTTYQL